jgi:hypothetical protein
MNMMSIASKLTAVALLATLLVPVAQFAQADVEPTRPSTLMSTIDRAERDAIVPIETGTVESVESVGQTR